MNEKKKHRGEIVQMMLGAVSTHIVHQYTRPFIAITSQTNVCEIWMKCDINTSAENHTQLFNYEYNWMAWHCYACENPFFL